MIQEISNNYKIKFVKKLEFWISLMDCLFFKQRKSANLKPFT